MDNDDVFYGAPTVHHLACLIRQSCDALNMEKPDMQVIIDTADYAKKHFPKKLLNHELPF